MMQHIHDQFKNDCVPRFAYCFAEESKNSFMSDLAKKCRNKETLPEEVLLMHEMWVSSGCPSVAKLRRKRVAKTQGISNKRRCSRASTQCCSESTEEWLSSDAGESEVDQEIE